jgi:phage terminase small subunit
VTLDLRPKGGRRSRSAFTVVEGGVQPRPEPPDYLTKEEAVEWERIVARMPADWFTAEIWPLLAAYCQHIVMANEITKQFRSIKFDIKLGIKEMKMHGYLRAMLIREHRAMILIATKLRLTPSSSNEKTTEDRRKAREPKFRQPFQVGDLAAEPDFGDADNSLD